MPQQIRPSSPPDRPSGYVAALLLTAVTVLVAFVLRDYLSRSIFILFAAPVALTAWYAGSRPALLSAFVGLIAADVLFVSRGFGLLPRDGRDFVAMGIYLSVALIIVHVNGLLAKSRDQIAGYAQQLEDQAMEMQAQASELEQQTEEAQALNEELEALNESIIARTAAQLAEAQSLARMGSWEWEIGRNTITWSDEMYRLYGLEPGSGDVDFETYQSLIHPDDRVISQEVVGEALKTGEPFTFHHRVIRADGAERVFHARGMVVRDGNGVPVRMLGTGQDVTEMRRAESALRNAAEHAARRKAAEAAAQHLDRVLSQAPVVIAVLSGPDHVFELANEKAFEMLGNRQLIGKPLSDAIPTFAGGQYGALLDMVYKTGEPFVGREMYAAIDPNVEGHGGYFNFVLQPLTNEEGVYAILIVANEVSDLVRSRLAAEESQHLAQAASRTKSDFLARMSHELRTPLAAIIGYGELLADGITGPINEEQGRQLGRIRASANHLLSIIDEILTLARMEAGKENVRMEDVDVHDLLDSVASMAEPLAAAKGLHFTLGSTPHTIIHTDPMKVRQVLLNLISNAVKYTDSGAVSLSSVVSDGHVDFLVTDTGLGVEEKHLEKIFEPFWQVEQTTTRRSGGTGLGLAVTRQFVDLIGGKISVESELGMGSTFRVAIPVQPVTGSGVAES